jgi:hypothetical protein
MRGGACPPAKATAAVRRQDLLPAWAGHLWARIVQFVQAAIRHIPAVCPPTELAVTALTSKSPGPGAHDAK